MKEIITSRVCLITGRSRSLHRKNTAVSPVIGTVLIIALVVITIAICTSVFMTNSDVEMPYITGVRISQQENEILITYLNGDPIERDNLKIMVDGFDISSMCTGPDDVFGPGSVLVWDSKAFSVNYVSVVAVNPSTSSEQLIVQKKVDKTGESSIGESAAKVIRMLNENVKIYDNIEDFGPGVWDKKVKKYYVALYGSILTDGNTYWIVNDINGKIYLEDNEGDIFIQVIERILSENQYLAVQVDMIYTIDSSGIINGEVRQGAIGQKGDELYVYRGASPADTFMSGDWIKARTS